MKRAIKYWPYRVLLNTVAGHLVVGAANREYLTHYAVPETKLFDAPHAVDDAWFAAEARTARASGSRERERAALGIPADAKVAVFVGRLVDMKRPLDFIRALTDSVVPSNLWGLVVGSGPLERDARALAGHPRRSSPVSPDFEISGPYRHVYASADMLVLPSDARETWGLVANEALAAGVPIVVSDAAGCARDLAIGEAGRQYRMGQVSQLAAAMTSMAAALDGQPARRGRCGQRAVGGLRVRCGGSGNASRRRDRLEGSRHRPARPPRGAQRRAHGA